MRKRARKAHTAGRRRHGQTKEAEGAQQEVAIREQLLLFEARPYAQYEVSGGLFRLIALLVHRQKRKRRGEYVPPLPWMGIVISTLILIAVIGGVAVIVWLSNL